jgi:double-stranded uracil-DNA glycosylase
LSATELRPLLVGLPPLIADGSRVLILGSFPSEMSLAKREYYGNPQNAFWTVMESLFGIDRSLPYQKRMTRLAANGVAVWDVIARCDREGSGDDRITDARPNPLVALLEVNLNIRHVAFNGGTAYATARALTPEIFSMSRIQIERMPSTSPRHARMRLAEKVETWAWIKAWLTAAP